MARSYTRISVQRYFDEDWWALTATEQGVFDFLLTHPKLSICGALDVKLPIWVGRFKGMTLDELEGCLVALEHDHNLIRWDRSTGELVIRTFVTNDGILQNKNSGRGMWSAWATIESRDLRIFLVDNFEETAFEERFNPPFLSPEIAGRHDRSDERYRRSSERAIEPTQPQPQPNPQPATTDRSNTGYEFTSDVGEAPVVAARTT